MVAFSYLVCRFKPGTWQEEAEKAEAKGSEQVQVVQLVLLLSTSVVQAFGETAPWLGSTAMGPNGSKIGPKARLRSFRPAAMKLRWPQCCGLCTFGSWI